MKKLNILLTTIVIFSSFLIFSKAENSRAEERRRFVPGEVLVKFKDDASLEDVASVHKRLGGRVKQAIPDIFVQVVSVEGAVGQAVSAYAKEGLVEYAEPNFMADVLDLAYHPTDIYYSAGKQWALHNTGQVFDEDRHLTGSQDADIDAPEAWALTHGSETVKVAVLDTGINQTHEDLSEKLVLSKDFSSSDNGVEDIYGHGTHVSGIVAALTDNDPENDGTSVGIAGTGHNTSLMVGKVCSDSGSCPYSWVANGVIWAADNGAKVINMSLGGSNKSKTLETAVNHAWNAGVVLVGAAGNSNNPSKTYPGAYDNVISVAATDANDKKAAFSSYGKWVDVAAPGVEVFSTFPNHAFTLEDPGRNRNQLYGYGSGTSMSAPIVAGIAGLVWSTDYSLDDNGNPSNVKVRAQIEKNAEPIVGTGNYWKHGRVNAYKAVSVDQPLDTSSAGGGGGDEPNCPPKSNSPKCR